MKHEFLLFGCLVLVALLSAQQPAFVCAKQMKGTANNYSQGIAIDVTGNVYTIGYFGGTVDFDPGPGTYNLTAIGLYDVFISKLDTQGNFLWAKQLGGLYSESYGSAIALDKAGNIYTTGSFDKTVDFDPGPGIFNLTDGEQYAGIHDSFVSKLDAQGNFFWAKQMKGNGYVYSSVGRAIKVDAESNVYTSGSFEGTVDFDPGPGTPTEVTSSRRSFTGT